MYKIYSKFYFPFTSLVEVWKDAPAWENCYEVSSLGRVRSKDKVRIKERQGKLVQAKYKGRIRKQEITNTGYNRVNLRDCGRDNNVSVHRLVAEAFITNTESKPTVNHIDGNKLNNNVSNLEWSTLSEQMIHAVKNNLIGECKRTVSPKTRQEIYNYYTTNKVSINELARKFNIKREMASGIAAGKIEPNWKIPHGDLLEMVRLGKQGWSAEILAEKFNCSKSQAWRIINGKSRLLCLEGLDE